MTERQLQNLRPKRSLSREEAKRMGKKGGKKRAENLAKRKRLKEELQALLQMKQSNGKTIQENWMLAIANKLLKGDIKASIFVRDTIGEKPKEQVEIASEGITDIAIQFVDKTQKTKKKEVDPKIVGEYTRSNENGERE